MPKKNGTNSRSNRTTRTASAPRPSTQSKDFHIELLNTSQKMAWASFLKHDVLFLIGPAGTGKTFLATAFAVNSFLKKECRKIIMTRPIVESGERLGFLPGDFNQKTDPYMMPMYDCVDKLLGRDPTCKDRVLAASEVSPFAYMRGRTFSDAVCICDEAQNATMSQLKMFLTRFSEGSKIIITGDPNQSDIPGPCALTECVRKLNGVPGISVVEFKSDSIVRHPLIGTILDRLDDSGSS